MVTSGEGIAILEQGLCFGGGDLQEYGINSNTSANGFLKCTYKKVTHVENNSPSKSPSKKSPDKAKPKGDDDASDSELAEDSEREENDNNNSNTTYEWVALNSFRELY